jgi:hypothetical protein
LIGDQKRFELVEDFWVTSEDEHHPAGHGFLSHWELA